MIRGCVAKFISNLSTVAFLVYRGNVLEEEIQIPKQVMCLAYMPHVRIIGAAGTLDSVLDERIY
jgi:hypothetical protein